MVENPGKGCVHFLVLWNLVLKGNVTEFLVPGASPSEGPLGKVVTGARERPDPGCKAATAPRPMLLPLGA